VGLRAIPHRGEATAGASVAVQVQQGIHTPDSASITLAVAGKLWVAQAEAEELEAATIRQYRQHVELHINPLIGDVKLSKLTAPGVEDFRDTLIKTRSRAMAKKVLGSLKALISEAQRRGKVSHNVAREVKVRQPARHKEHVEVGKGIPTKAEIKGILATAQGRWRPLLVTATFTGLRASELRGLTWDNVDFSNKVIRVRQRADRYNEIGSPKSGAGKRDAVIPPVVLNTLREWKLKCPKGYLGLVFPNGAGNVEGLGNIYRRGFAPAQVSAGAAIDSCEVDGEGKPIIKAKYGMHALRHFYASWLIEQGFPPKKVQAMLGHSSIQMTYDVYGHLFPSEDDDFEKLAAGERALLA
jgi:integrase